MKGASSNNRTRLRIIKRLCVRGRGYLCMHSCLLDHSPCFFVKGERGGGIALINTMAATAGAVGPALTGFLRKATGDFVYALHFFSGGLILAAIFMIACMSRSQITRSDIRAIEG